MEDYVSIQFWVPLSEARAYFVSVPVLPCSPLFLDDHSSFLVLRVLKRWANLTGYDFDVSSLFLARRLELSLGPEGKVSLNLSVK